MNVFEHIKRLIGWCQKNELEFAHSNTINPRMSMNAVHAKYGAGAELRQDYRPEGQED